MRPASCRLLETQQLKPSACRAVAAANTHVCLNLLPACLLLLLFLYVCLQVGQVSAEHPELCERCLPVVEALGFKLPGIAAAAAAEKATAAA